MSDYSVYINDVLYHEYNRIRIIKVENDKYIAYCNIFAADSNDTTNIQEGKIIKIYQGTTLDSTDPIRFEGKIDNVNYSNALDAEINATGQGYRFSEQKTTPYFISYDTTVSNVINGHTDTALSQTTTATETSTNYNWPYTTSTAYTYDSTNISVTGGIALLKDGPSLYAWWHLNESSGTNASDSSGNGRNGTTVNMEDGDWVAGKLNNCLSFDGTNEYVNCANIANFERTEAFSIEAWIKTSVDGKQIVSRIDNSAPFRGWSVYIAGGLLAFQLTHDNSPVNRIVVTGDTTSLNDNDWHHVVVTYDGSADAGGVKLYVDNNSETLNVIANSLTSTTQNSINCQIAARNGANDCWNGLIDEVVIYDVVLTSTEVAARYNGGSGTETMPGDYPTTNPSIVANTEINGIQTITSFDNFSETATKPTNTEIKYILSDDNGATWKWWNGAAWVTSDENYSQTNTATIIDTNISNFPVVNNRIKQRAFLHTSVTSATPELDNVKIDYKYILGAGPIVIQPSNNATPTQTVRIYGQINGTAGIYNGQYQQEVVYSLLGDTYSGISGSSGNLTTSTDTWNYIDFVEISPGLTSGSVTLVIGASTLCTLEASDSATVAAQVDSNFASIYGNGILYRTNISNGSYSQGATNIKMDIDGTNKLSSIKRIAKIVDCNYKVYDSNGTQVLDVLTPLDNTSANAVTTLTAGIDGEIVRKKVDDQRIINVCNVVGNISNGVRIRGYHDSQTSISNLSTATDNGRREFTYFDNRISNTTTANNMASEVIKNFSAATTEIIWAPFDTFMSYDNDTLIIDVGDIVQIVDNDTIAGTGVNNYYRLKTMEDNVDMFFSTVKLVFNNAPENAITRLVRLIRQENQYTPNPTGMIRSFSPPFEVMAENNTSWADTKAAYVRFMTPYKNVNEVTEVTTHLSLVKYRSGVASSVTVASNYASISVDNAGANISVDAAAANISVDAAAANISVDAAAANISVDAGGAASAVYYTNQLGFSWGGNTAFEEVWSFSIGASANAWSMLYVNIYNNNDTDYANYYARLYDGSSYWPTSAGFPMTLSSRAMGVIPLPVPINLASGNITLQMKETNKGHGGECNNFWVRMGTHPHTDTDPTHPHTDTDPEHPHTDTDPTHPHTDTDPEHLHPDTDEGHPHDGNTNTGIVELSISDSTFDVYVGVSSTNPDNDELEAWQTAATHIGQYTGRTNTLILSNSFTFYPNTRYTLKLKPDADKFGFQGQIEILFPELKLTT